MEKVIEFLKRHNFENFTEIPKPLPHCNFELLAEDDYGFVKDLSDDMKVRLIKCTKSIGLKPLNDLICGYIAAQYRGRVFALVLNHWKTRTSVLKILKISHPRVLICRYANQGHQRKVSTKQS